MRKFIQIRLLMWHFPKHWDTCVVTQPPAFVLVSECSCKKNLVWNYGSNTKSICISIHSSTHPFSAVYPGLGHEGSSLRKDAQMLPSYQPSLLTSNLFYPGHSEAFPGPPRDGNCLLGLHESLLPEGHAWNTTPGAILISCLNHLREG